VPPVDAERVSDLAAGIAEQLGAGQDAASRCRLGGLLHDIGTVAVSDRVLGLVGPPTERDRVEYEAHPGDGARLVRGVAGVSDAADVVACHEERFDGTGYPAGLSGQEIPLEARIVACAAAFVKLARTLAGKDAAGALERQSGSALDPEVVTAALELLARQRGHAARHLRDVPAA
jgi:HD-GYP domain-containing protein (c-di-GMP phosphodiesterase class II)